jgi:hypothetical protein
MTMKRLALVLAIPAIASCASDSQFGYKEEFSLYYDQPARETTTERIERREIVAWGKNPKDKERIGFLHKYETKVVGSRQYRECWYIFDKLGVTRVGFITAEGKFHRFTNRGTLEEEVLYEGKIVTTGLKIFFGLPLTHNVDLEEIDPYK